MEAASLEAQRAKLENPSSGRRHYASPARPEVQGTFGGLKRSAAIGHSSLRLSGNEITNSPVLRKTALGSRPDAKPAPPRTTGNTADQNRDNLALRKLFDLWSELVGKSKRKSRNISTEALSGRLSPIREDTVVRIITLEDHFATPMFQERFPQGNVPGHFLADRGRYISDTTSQRNC